MKEPKPIFIISVPIYLPSDQYAELCNNVSNMLKDDYHVLFVNCGYDDFRFELFNPNIELNDIDIQELKDKLDYKSIYDSQHKSIIPKDIND